MSFQILTELIESHNRIVFFGGAGTSTASGIPDFRSANGLYANQFEGLSPEIILSKSFFYKNPEKFLELSFVASQRVRKQCGFEQTIVKEKELINA